MSKLAIQKTTGTVKVNCTSKSQFPTAHCLLRCCPHLIRAASTSQIQIEHFLQHFSLSVTRKRRSTALIPSPRSFEAARLLVLFLAFVVLPLCNLFLSFLLEQLHRRQCSICPIIRPTILALEQALHPLRLT